MRSPKYQSQLAAHVHTADDFLIKANGIIRTPSWWIYMLFDTRRGVYGLPWGKIDNGETNEYALHREVQEEIGVNVIAVSECLCGWKTIGNWGRSLNTIYEIEVDSEPYSVEEHSRLCEVQIVEANNTLGRGIVEWENKFMTDVEVLVNFYDIVLYMQRDRLRHGDYPFDDAFDIDEREDYYVQYLDTRVYRYKIVPYSTYEYRMSDVLVLIQSREKMQEYVEKIKG